MTIELTDDGSLDTVVRCTECGQEERYNFDPRIPGSDYESDKKAYAAFVEWAIADMALTHECKQDDN